MTKINKTNTDLSEQRLLNKLTDLPAISIDNYYADILLNTHDRQLIINVDICRSMLAFSVHEAPNLDRDSVTFLTKVNISFPELPYRRAIDSGASRVDGYHLKAQENFKLILDPYSFAFCVTEDSNTGFLLMINECNEVLERIVIGLQSPTPNLTVHP